MKSLYPLVAVILGGCCVAAFAAESPRPNIVLFLADDLGWADVPWHGSSYKLPHLDRLAAQGVRLESHYVHPMCSPTRAALMTGRYASRFGVAAAQTHRAFPSIPSRWPAPSSGRLPDRDHRQMASWLCAEWGPQRFGFDHGYGSLAGGCGPYDHRYKTGEFTRTWHRNGLLIEEQGHITDLIAREAVEWLKQRNESRSSCMSRLRRFTCRSTNRNHGSR